MELAVIGRDVFCLGFRLAGIRKVFETASLMEAVQAVKGDSSVGVVVVDDGLFMKLDDFQKQSLENSPKPVFISLSTRASDEDLKRMIKKSIGVEL